MSDYLTNIALNNLSLKPVIQPRLPGWFEPWPMAAEPVGVPMPDLETETGPVEVPAPTEPSPATPDPGTKATPIEIPTLTGPSPAIPEPPIEAQPTSPHQPPAPDTIGRLPNSPQPDSPPPTVRLDRPSEPDLATPVDYERLLSQLSPDQPPSLSPVLPEDGSIQPRPAESAPTQTHLQPPLEPPNISSQPAEAQMPALSVSPTTGQELGVVDTPIDTYRPALSPVDPAQETQVRALPDLPKLDSPLRAGIDAQPPEIVTRKLVIEQETVDRPALTQQQLIEALAKELAPDSQIQPKIPQSFGVRPNIEPNPVNQNDEYEQRLAAISEQLARFEQPISASAGLHPASQAPPDIASMSPIPIESVAQPKPAPASKVRASIGPALSPPSSVETATDPKPAPSIQVTIGRIEVRATAPPTAVPKKRRAPSPGMSLDDYLRQRDQGGRR